MILLRRNRKSFIPPKANKPKDCDLTWDVNGWKRNDVYTYLQKDWNQTLITKVNQCSAYIHQQSGIGGATVIEVGTNLEGIINDLDYCNSNDNRLGSRYDVVFKKELQSTVRVYHDKKPDLVMVVKTIGVEEIYITNKRKRLLIR